jgi:hypothetical protein
MEGLLWHRRSLLQRREDQPPSLCGPDSLVHPDVSPPGRRRENRQSRKTRSHRSRVGARHVRRAKCLASCTRTAPRSVRAHVRSDNDRPTECQIGGEARGPTSNSFRVRRPFAIRLWAVTTGRMNPAAVRRATDPTTSGISTSWFRRSGLSGSTRVPFKSRKTACRIDRFVADTTRYSIARPKVGLVHDGVAAKGQTG